MALLAKLTNAGIKLHDDFEMMTAGEIEEKDHLVLARYTSGALIWFPIAYFPKTTSCFSYFHLFDNGYKKEPVQFMEILQATQDTSFTPCRISKLNPEHFKPGPEPPIKRRVKC